MTLDSLFIRWQAEFGPDACNFVRDGIVGDEAEWRASNPRVLFLAKDANNNADILRQCSYDLRTLFRKPADFSGHRRTFEKNLGRWAYGLHHGMANARQSFDDADDESRHSALLRSAVMNLKKTAGRGASSASKIKEHSRRFGGFIMEEITLLSPTVVVCCGTFEFVRQFLRDSPRDKQPGDWWWQQNVLWLVQWHPSAHKTPYEMHSKLVVAYQRALGTCLRPDPLPSGGRR